MEQNKMTNAKDWKIVESSRLSESKGYRINIQIDGPRIHLDFWVHGAPVKSEEVAKCYANSIITAVNNTYGAGINPKAVADMLEALKEAKRMYESVQPAGGWQGVYESIKSAINDAKI